MNPESIVIVKWAKGFVAYIRYEDSAYDRNISHSYRSILHSEIDKYVREVYGIQEISQNT